MSIILMPSGLAHLIRDHYAEDPVGRKEMLQCRKGSLKILILSCDLIFFPNTTAENDRHLHLFPPFLFVTPTSNNSSLVGIFLCLFWASTAALKILSMDWFQGPKESIFKSKCRHLGTLWSTLL